MSPQNWLCRSERNPALDTLALNSPLGHFNGDQCTPSLHQMDQNHGDSKTQSLTRLMTHAAISTFSTSHNSISSQYSQPFTSLAAPKANPIFHAANKNLFLKTPFDYRHLTSAFYLLFLTNLARALQHSARKQHNVNTHTLHPSSLLTTNFPSLLTNQLLRPKPPSTLPSNSSNSKIWFYI